MMTTIKRLTFQESAKTHVHVPSQKTKQKYKKYKHETEWVSKERLL